MTELKEYSILLRNHEWTYEWSDDHNVCRAGRATHKILCEIAKESPNHARMYELAADYYLGSDTVSADEAAWRWVGAYLWAHKVKTSEDHAKAFCYHSSISWVAVDECTMVKS